MDSRRFPWLIAAVILITRLPTLWIHVLDKDESVWAVSAAIWLNGGTPFIDFVDIKPLGVFGYFAAVFGVFGSANLLFVHAITIIVVGLTAWALFRIGSLLASPRAGHFAALFYALFSTISIPKIVSTNMETVMNLPLALGILALMLAYSGRPLWNIFSAGVWIGLACCLKYQAGIIGLMAAGIVFASPPKGLRFRGTLVLALGALVPLGGCAAYLYGVDALWEIYYWTLASSGDYISAGASELNVLKRIGVRGGFFVFCTLPLWVLGIPELKKRSGWIISLWFLVTTVAIIPGWRLYPHYFLLWLPPLSILAAIGLDRKWEAWQPTWRIKTILAFSFVMAFLALIPRFAFETYHRHLEPNSPFEYEAIGKWVKENTEKGDRVAVWGIGPEVYYFSQRFPAHRFTWGDQLIGRGSLPGGLGAERFRERIDPRAWDLWAQDMAEHPPVMIVDMGPTKLHDMQFFPIENYPPLRELLTRKYREETEVRGARIYRLLGPQVQ